METGVGEPGPDPVRPQLKPGNDRLRCETGPHQYRRSDGEQCCVSRGGRGTDEPRSVVGRRSPVRMIPEPDPTPIDPSTSGATSARCTTGGGSWPPASSRRWRRSRPSTRAIGRRRTPRPRRSSGARSPPGSVSPPPAVPRLRGRSPGRTGAGVWGRRPCRARTDRCRSPSARRRARRG